MPRSTFGRGRGVGVVTAGSLLAAALLTGCEIAGTAESAPPPTVLSADTPPPATPPWTLAQLVHHQCIVLGPDELTRFGFEKPAKPERSESYCRWQTPSTAPVQIAMYFAPDPRHRYPDLEGMRRGEQHFRTLSIAGRPAFLIDEHNPGGSRNCRIWVSVPSGGAIQFEYARRGPGDESDVCPEAVDIVTVIAERVR